MWLLVVWQIDGWMGGWMDGWRDGRMDGWMEIENCSEMFVLSTKIHDTTLLCYGYIS
jgi:hypothetical protein